MSADTSIKSLYLARPSCFSPCCARYVLDSTVHHHHHHGFTTVKTTNRIYHLQGKHHRRGKYPLIETRRVNGKQIDSITANNILISSTRRRREGRERRIEDRSLSFPSFPRHRLVAGCSVTFVADPPQRVMMDEQLFWSSSIKLSSYYGRKFLISPLIPLV